MAVPKNALVYYLLLLDHVGLPEDLHGVDVAGVDLLDEPNLPEGALPDHLEGLEVVHAEARALQAQELRLFGGVLGPLLHTNSLGQVGLLKTISVDKIYLYFYEGSGTVPFKRGSRAVVGFHGSGSYFR